MVAEQAQLAGQAVSGRARSSSRWSPRRSSSRLGAIGYTSPTVTAAGQQYPPEGQIPHPAAGSRFP